LPADCFAPQARSGGNTKKGQAAHTIEVCAALFAAQCSDDLKKMKTEPGNIVCKTIIKYNKLFIVVFKIRWYNV
jgi:hypothetical protein